MVIKYVSKLRCFLVYIKNNLIDLDKICIQFINTAKILLY